MVKNEMGTKKVGERPRTEGERHGYIPQTAVVAKERNRQRYPRLPEHVSGGLSKVLRLIWVGH